MPNYNILDDKGQDISEMGRYCPSCGGETIDKGAPSPADFDENGWFHTIKLTCGNPKCLHTWNNRVVVMAGNKGHLVRYR